MNEGVGFGFVIIELLVRYGPPRRVFFFGLRIDDKNDASKPKRIVVSTFSGKFLTTNREPPMREAYGMAGTNNTMFDKMTKPE